MAKVINKKYTPRWDAGDHFFYAPNAHTDAEYMYLVVDIFDLEMIDDVPSPFYAVINLNTGRHTNFICATIDLLSNGA